jgi:hypothetical protein
VEYLYKEMAYPSQAGKPQNHNNPPIVIYSPETITIKREEEDFVYPIATSTYRGTDSSRKHVIDGKHGISNGKTILGRCIRRNRI